MSSRRAVIAGAALTAAGAALPGVASASSAPLSIATYGDSLTNGYGSSHGLGYRKQLATQLNRAGVEHTIYNSAQNGGTTVELLGWAQRVTREVQPGVVVLNIGTNDAVQSDDSLQRFEGRYAQLLVEILWGKPDVKIVACFIQPSAIEWFVPREKQINDAIFRQAAYGVGPHGGRVLGPVDLQYLAMYGSADGVHPNDQGYDLMGFSIFQVIGRHLGLAV